MVKSAIEPKIRSLDFNEEENKLLVGTYGSEIYELSGSVSSNKWTAKNLMKGHYSPNHLWTNEVWGLEILHTDNDRFLTCSDDATLRVYSNS